jgi:hypothetical protein
MYIQIQIFFPSMKKLKNKKLEDPFSIFIVLEINCRLMEEV